MIGLRREDKNEWERRVALTPLHVKHLLDSGLDVAVETATHRAYPDADYRAVGARVGDGFDDARVVLGIKEVALDRLQADKTYVFFSHTTKAQSHNMPLLRRMLDLGCTLLDYEQITDGQGRRLIFFGRHAGYAGMIDTLWVLGRRLALDGFDTVLQQIKPAHQYTTLAQALEHIADVGRQLARDGLPAGLDPIVCGFTGTGNVSTGAQDVLSRLPVLDLKPEDLRARKQHRRDAIYKVVLDLNQRFQRDDGGPVEIAELAAHPERFTNATLPYLPGLTVLVNGMFWVPALPRLLTLADMRALHRSGELASLRVIADISCDIGGAIEATYKATTPANPVFVYDVPHERFADGFAGDGPVILAIDNLPAELPRESSQDFGDTLLPFVEPLYRCDWTRPFADLALPSELSRAIIAHRGELIPRFEYLRGAVARHGGRP